jgi:hypothetical protein
VAVPLSLGVVGLVNAITAGTFAAVGIRLYHRPTRNEHLLAMRALVTWWGSMGIFLALQAFLVLVVVSGSLPVPLFQDARLVTGPLVALAAWGLSFHVLFLSTGRRGWALPLGVYFGLIGIAYDLVALLHPITSLEPTAWEVTGTTTPPLVGDPLWTFVLAGVGLPLIASCLTYLTLVRKLETREQRRRVLLVGTGILLWVASGLVAQLSGGPLARFFTITIMGLLASLAVFLAYFPPDWLRRRDALAVPADLLGRTETTPRPPPRPPGNAPP